MPSPQTLQSTEITGIDCHAHVFERGLPLAAHRRHVPEYDALVHQYLALLDRQGLSHGVLVQPSFLGTDNRYWLQAVARHPDRLRGVAVVEPAIPLSALRALRDQGNSGVRLNLVGGPIPDFRQAGWQALLSHLRELGAHLEIHRDACDLPGLLDALLPTGCRIVIDHFGRPDAALGRADPGFSALLRAAASGRVWVKLSAAYRTARTPRAAPALRDAALAALDAQSARAAATALLGAFGPDRLVWGSDWPHTQHQEFIDYPTSRDLLDDWVPDAAARQRILVETPAELFGFRKT